MLEIDTSVSALYLTFYSCEDQPLTHGLYFEDIFPCGRHFGWSTLKFQGEGSTLEARYELRLGVRVRFRHIVVKVRG